MYECNCSWFGLVFFEALEELRSTVCSRSLMSRESRGTGIVLFNVIFHYVDPATYVSSLNFAPSESKCSHISTIISPESTSPGQCGSVGKFVVESTVIWE